ncbi:hypothetical protein [Rufibacter ruber]|uniref:hypothetical protein n=1 Tax=Rufibacter ruber TaxID=1783499 RepID=UPI00082D339D|nr:hypothetical protein [Rufibacter ruber]
MKFKKIRVDTLTYWFKNSNRSRSATSLSDCYNDTFLCRLQGEDFHISFLCNLAEWLNNITDILTDTRLDECDAENDLLLDAEAIFRFYTRLFLVVSEVIEDFIDLHRKIKELRSKKSAGKDFAMSLSLNHNLQDISDYINSVCKHKVTGLHCHNHHLAIEF